MKKILLAITFCLSTLFILNSCQPLQDPICNYSGTGTINTLAVFPDSIPLGSTIVGQFKVTGLNGCSQFNGFYNQYEPYMVKDYRIINIPPAQISGTGCVCEEIAPIFDANYSYTPVDTGMYYFQYIIYGDISQYDSVYVYQ